MTRRRNLGQVLAIAVVCATVLVACGGGSSSDSSETSEASATGIDLGTVPSSSDIDDLIGTLLEGATGARGEKVEGPGKVRFFNVLSLNGKAVDVDVWWGQPDEGAKVATVAFGEISDYVTPMMSKGFNSAIYSVTATGTTDVLWSWDRFSPDAETVRTVVFMPTDEGTSVSQTDLEEQSSAKDFNGDPTFPPADAGKVRLLWRPLGRSIDSAGPLLTVSAGGSCLTNGSGIAGPDGNQVDGSSFQVEPGTKLYLTPSERCGTSSALTATAPAAPGRAVLFVYLDAAGQPVMKVVPVG